MYFAQAANLTQISRVPALMGSQVAQDRGKPMVCGGSAGTHHYVYVDNFGFLDVKRERFQQALDASVSALELFGLEMHVGRVIDAGVARDNLPT